MILSRRQIRLLIPLGIAISLSLPGDQTLYAVLPTQASTIGISLGAVGVLLGINRAIRVPGNPIAGLLYDQLGRRRLFLLGLLLGILSTASYAIARNFYEWLAGRLMWGAAWSLLNVGGLTMVLDVTDDRDRGRVTGLYQLSLLLGLAFSPVLGGLLTDVLGFRLALLVCASITGAGFMIALFALPETRPTPPAASTHIRPMGTFVTTLIKQTYQRLLLYRELFRPAALGRRPAGARVAQAQADGAGQTQRGEQAAVYYIYLMTFFAGNGVVMSTISLYLQQNFGDEILIGDVAVGVASLGGILLATRSLIGMVAGPVSGHLSDRWGDRWPVILGGIITGGIGFGVLIASRAVWTVPLGVVLIALSTGALLTALATGGRQGWAIGRLVTAGDLGSAAGPLLAYALLSLIDLRWVYLLCSLGFASTLLLAVRYMPARREI